MMDVVDEKGNGFLDIWGVRYYALPGALIVSGPHGGVELPPPRIPPLISQYRTLFDVIFGTQYAHALNIMCDDAPSENQADVQNFIGQQNTLAIVLMLLFSAAFGGIYVRHACTVRTPHLASRGVL